MDSHTSATDDQRIIAAAADRNKDAICSVLSRLLPPPLNTQDNNQQPGLILEIASGTGQHIAHFASSLSPTTTATSPQHHQYTFQPSDMTDDLFPSIAAWSSIHLPNININPPIVIDASSPPDAWGIPPSSCTAVICTNMCHIAPFEATQGLMRGAGEVLADPGGRLFIYGPFLVDGRPTTESNDAFDKSLRSRDGRWGLRDVKVMVEEGRKRGLELVVEEEEGGGVIEMPANNFMLVFEKKR
jgi:hypothetical protein